MTTLQSFDSFEEMMDSIDKSRKAADERVESWQAAVKPGDFFVRMSPAPGLTIYGEILDPGEDAELYAEPQMKGFRPTRAYSKACPEGEMGDVHVSAIWKLIPRESFEKARELGWPDLLPEQACLLYVTIVRQEDGKVRLGFHPVLKG